jgi:hypothetical protein
MAPMTYGVIQPVIILPEEMVHNQPDSDETWLSLVHELTHIKRSDFALSITTRLVDIIAGWNPLVKSLKGDIDLHCELACDADVLTGLDNEPSRYARALMRVSQMIGRQPALSMSSAGPILLHRINTINEAMKTNIRSSSRTMAYTLSALFLLIPALLTACVGFTESDETVVQADAVYVEDVVFVEAANSVEERLIVLETEYAYLEGQYDEVSAEMRYIEQSESPKPTGWRKLSTRRQLLEGMMNERARELEETRMEVVVGKALQSR